MSKVKIQGNASGTGIFTVAAPATNTDRTITLPDVDATVLTTAGGTITGSSPALNIDATSGNANIWFKDNGTNTFAIEQQPVAQGGTYISNRVQGGTYNIRTTPPGGSLQNSVLIDSYGRLNLPYQPAFYAYNGAAQNPGSVYTVQFTIAALNNGGHYNTSNYRFTAPIAGKYVFTFSGMSNGSYNRFGLFVNNTLYSDQRFSANQGYENFGATWIISLSTNDYVEIKNDLNSGGQGDIHGDYRNFGGYLIG